MHRWKRKPPRQQPPSSYAGCTETSTEEDVDVGKDFGTLVDAPLSKGGHFVFKSERDWSAADCSSEFFTLNLNMLSAAIDCIPFNGYVDVDDRYFTVSWPEGRLIYKTNKVEQRVVRSPNFAPQQ